MVDEASGAKLGPGALNLCWRYWPTAIGLVTMLPWLLSLGLPMSWLCVSQRGLVPVGFFLAPLPVFPRELLEG